MFGTACSLRVSHVSVPGGSSDSSFSDGNYCRVREKIMQISITAGSCSPRYTPTNQPAQFTTHPCSLFPHARTCARMTYIVQLGLQVRVGQDLASVGEAVQEGLNLHQRASEVSSLGHIEHPPTYFFGRKLASPRRCCRLLHAAFRR